MNELIQKLEMLSSLEEEGFIKSSEIESIIDNLEKKLEKCLGTMNYALVKKLCTLQNN